ncbi:MAG: KH domain-containing protein [Erysipelotrichaceae bacterium]|nr:KH domain-containing protein [Erysipelotrichaceae bacterium]MDY3934057.1 KH domain-containing protein [Bacilli bacterium]
MNLVALTEAIIKKIVSDPESVSIKEFDTEEENTIQIEVLISSSDMGKVIGKNGKIINSIRTIVQAASSLEDNKRVKINVDSY